MSLSARIKKLVWKSWEKSRGLVIEKYFKPRQTCLCKMKERQEPRNVENKIWQSYEEQQQWGSEVNASVTWI